MAITMHSSPEPDAYYDGCNPALWRAVPTGAWCILDVGCGAGNLGRALKQMQPGRKVLGVERVPSVAARAAQYLDVVFALNIETETPPVTPGTFDCLIFGDVLNNLIEPEGVRRRLKPLLKPDGLILCSVPNVQHHSIIAALCQSDFQYALTGLLDASHLRLFTYSTLTKLLLDAGFAPVFLDDVVAPCPSEFLAAAQPLLRYLGLHPERTRRYLNAYQYVVQGVPLPDLEVMPGGPADAPLTFVACVSDETVLHGNLLRSPCLGPGTAHEVILLRNCTSAGDGLNEGIRRAQNEIVVCVHQDVYLPRGWPQRFLAQYRRAEAAFGRVGVAGVFGVSRDGTTAVAAGRVVDRDRLVGSGGSCPAPVEALDELLLAVPRDTPLRFDPSLGFHLYGADLCVAAREAGLAVAALDAVCFHHSPGVGLPESFWATADRFRAKWSHRLPVVTPCVVIEQDGHMHLP